MGRPRPLRARRARPGPRHADGGPPARRAACGPDFSTRSRVHLVETSPVLREAQQRDAAAAAPFRSPGTSGSPRCRPARRSSSRTSSSTRCRCASSSAPSAAGASASSGWATMASWPSGSRREPDARARHAGRPGDVLERPEAALGLASEIAGVASRKAAARRSSSTTATRVRPSATRCRRCAGHAYADPLAEPGEADLTVHVDFAELAAARDSRGARRARPGDAGRVPARARHRDPRRGAEARGRRRRRPRTSTRALARLTGAGPDGMGELFKAICIADPALSARRPALPRRRGRRMTSGMFIEAPELSSHSGVRHAFFTRRGGVSEGVYASLNGGLGSSDDPARVRENRRRMAAQLGVPAEALVSVHQVHSPEAIVVEEPFPARAPARRRHGDAAPGPRARDHDGRLRPGAVRRSRGRRRRRLPRRLARRALRHPRGDASSRWRASARDASASIAVLGPTIGPNAYEVGPEFVAQFAAPDAGERALLPGQRPRRPFDVRPARLYRRAARGGRHRRSRRSWRSAPIRTRSASSATAAPPIAASRTTAG